MATLVFFHAHPDDESIQTGGTMARAAAEGHRVVLVVATGGEHGETPDDLRPDESLAERRAVETARSAAALGIAEVVWLGYRDSGMTGWEQNAHPEAFVQAPVDDAAARLAAVLEREGAGVLVTYDWHGGYGHPDHIQVHRVGARAGELASTPRRYEATMNRDAIRGFMAMAREAGAPDDNVFDPDGPADDGNPFGSPDSEITTAVDISAFVGAKRVSMTCHSSQITDSSFFLQMPDEAFATAFGTEWFRQVHPPAEAERGTWLW